MRPTEARAEAAVVFEDVTVVLGGVTVLEHVTATVQIGRAHV